MLHPVTLAGCCHLVNWSIATARLTAILKHKLTSKGSDSVAAVLLGVPAWNASIVDGFQRSAPVSEHPRAGRNRLAGGL
eukprot:4019759-Prymnesium_polylepis.1